MTAPKTPQISIGGSKPKPDENKPLPQFRKDLQLIRGPDDVDGSPTYNLYDPVRSKYYRLVWYEAIIFEVLQPGMTIKQLAEILTRKTAMTVTPRDLEMFFFDAKNHNLLDQAHTSEDLYKDAESKSTDPFTWALFHYLYIRIPLFRPDKFLERTLKYALPLASKPALLLYFIIASTGFILLLNRFEEFINTFTYFFNWEGIFAYTVAIFAVKICHELGHAYTAKYYGLHIPTMGIALIVLWPVMFTDASDVWKLPSRRQRFIISGAGIAVELVIAGISTWGWIMTEPGILQSVFFLLASVTWISSLLINLNPCMRFDGYYLLSDLWGIDNLQTRAFAVTRWKLRELLFGINIVPPEVVSTRRLIGMMVYSIATWIYRITLYLAIAIIIYHKFTKVLGVILFVLEIAVFIIWPVASELKEMFQMKKFIKVNLRSVITTSVFTLALLWFVLPMPYALNFPAVTAPLIDQTIFIPKSGMVEKIYVKKGDYVKKGQPLILISSPEIEAEIRAATIDLDVVKKEIITAGLKEESRNTLAAKQAEMKAIHTKLIGFENLKRSLLLRASIDGTIYDWREDVKEGQFVKQDKEMGQIAQMDKIKVIAYVREDEVRDIQIGQEVAFKVSKSLESFDATIQKIREGRDVILEYHQLASIYGGDLPTLKGEKEGKLKLIESYYVIDITFKEQPSHLLIGQLGYVKASGPWRSRLMNVLRLVQKVFYRESGA